MLTRPGGRASSILYTCDGCGDTLVTDLHDIKLAQVVLRDEDWVTRKEGNDWCHYCEDCQDEYNDHR